MSGSLDTSLNNGADHNALSDHRILRMVLRLKQLHHDDMDAAESANALSTLKSHGEILQQVSLPSAPDVLNQLFQLRIAAELLGGLACRA
jgi:hypothetical protein